MNAYIVVGPTNVQPRLRRSLLYATDSGVVAIDTRTSFVRSFGLVFGSGFCALVYQTAWVRSFGALN